MHLPPRTKKSDRVYSGVIGLVRGVFRLFAIRFDLRGIEHIPASGAAVIACNHISFLDFTFVGLAAFRRGRVVRFLAKRGAFRNRVSGPFMRAMGHIPVDRTAGTAAARQAMAKLREGELVGIFPEATVSRAWTLKPFQAGAAALAVGQRVPLIPVITWGGHRLLTVDGHHSARRHMPVTIWVGEPILPEPSWQSSRRAERAELLREVESELWQRMNSMLEKAQLEYPEQPRDEADRWWLPKHLGGTAPDPADAAILDAERMLE